MTKERVTRDTFNDVMVPNYNPQPVIPVRGRGAKLWDQSGKEYIDFSSGIAVNSLGHCHPRLVKALKDQADKLWHLSNVYTNEPALRLAKKLAELTFADKVYFSNSGAEANEAAFKLVRKYANDHFGSEKNEIISFTQSFHGRTLFTVSVGGQPKYSKDFNPLPGGIVHGEFNSLESVKALISDRTCAVVLEPIQGEGGVIPAEKEFIIGVRELCDQYNVLLVFDEVQTGAGRTGKLYAYMDYGITPDVLTTAKGLGGGFPIGAMLATEKAADSLNFGSHGSTFGGNPLACSVALELLDIVNEKDFLDRVIQSSQLLVSSLETIKNKYSVIDQVRGKGLMLGCVLSEKWQGKAAQFMTAAREMGVTVLMAGPNVIRLVPPLNITEEETKEGIARFDQAVNAVVENVSS